MQDGNLTDPKPNLNPKPNPNPPKGKVPYSYWSLGGVLISLPKAVSP